SYTMSPSLSADGGYSVTATQSDTASNTGTSGAKSITIDKTAPAVSERQGDGGGTTFPLGTSGNVTSDGGASGTAPGDVATVNVSVTGTATQSGSTACSSGTWSYTMSPTLTADGPYSVTATQSDTASNTGTSGAKSIMIDKTAPVV